jgi:hypothetical protein
MSRFINLLRETLSVINEQDPAAVDPALSVDPAAMMAPSPPEGPIAQAGREDIEEPEETELRTEVKDLINLARDLFLYGLNSNRSEIDDIDMAKVTQRITNSNAKQIREVMTRMIKSNHIETGGSGG